MFAVQRGDDEPGEIAKVDHSALEYRSRRAALWRRGARFALTTFAMLCGICLLALVEGAALWWLGKGYTPPTAIEQFAIWDFSLSGDGAEAISCVSVHRAAYREAYRREIILHDLRRPETAVHLPCGELRPNAAAFSPAKDRIAIGSEDGAVYLWDAPFTAKSPRRIGYTSDGVKKMNFSPDGRYLAAVLSGEVHIWSLSPPRLHCKLRHEGVSIFAICFSADSRTLLTADDDGVLRWWRVDSGAPLGRISSCGESSFRAALSPDGRLAAMTSVRGGLHVWRLGDDAALWRNDLRVAGYGAAVAFSPCGQMVLATEWTDGKRCNIRLYDTYTGRRVGELTGHGARIAGLAFSSDHTLYSWDLRGVIRAWNVAERREVWRFRGAEWASLQTCFRDPPRLPRRTRENL